MIVITGAAGFIGSNMTGRLNEEGFSDIVLVDDFSSPGKKDNYSGKKFTLKVHRDEFPEWLESNHRLVQFVVHLGARTDTAENDETILNRLNLDYSKKLWTVCCNYGLPFIYASSAATYGKGDMGYSDNEDIVGELNPMNLYGRSKNEFDKWVLDQENKPWFWAGLKFFNVYGPNEYHKNRMASVVFHAYKSIMATGRMKLFRSHRPGYPDGEQRRDFVYVGDVTDIIYYMMTKREKPGIYNVGTGEARTFNDLAKSVFRAAGKEPCIEYIDIPEDIRDKYQYFTRADTGKLRAAGYTKPFTPLEEGVEKYVKQYLSKESYF